MGSVTRSRSGRLKFLVMSSLKSTSISSCLACIPQFCFMSPGQHHAFRGSTGVLRQDSGTLNWLEQRYNGLGKYEPRYGDVVRWPFGQVQSEDKFLRETEG